MPANIRVRCRYIDCKFLGDLFCTLANVEFAPKTGCQMYSPIESLEEVEVEEELDLEEEEDNEEDWLEEEEDDDDFGSGDLEE